MKVYLVYAYPDVEGVMYPCVERIFRSEDAAKTYMEQENLRVKWKRVVDIDHMNVD